MEIDIDSELHRLVYEYFEARILFGFYDFEEKLQSAPKIAESFHLSPSTVRQAFSQLEKQGYVKLEERKVARVAYQPAPGECRERAYRYFAERRKGITEFNQSGRLLLQPLWKEGLSRCSDELLLEFLAKAQKNPDSMAVRFFLYTLNMLDNQLVLNFFWEIIRYVRFPYLRKETEPLPSDLTSLPRKDILTFIGRNLFRNYELELEKVFAFLDESKPESAMEQAEPVPFEWSIHRHRPQLRYTLASQIIREAMNGRYPEGTYLPSISKMAELYGVSDMTIRRTLDILAGLGVTRSYHGRGTLVCMEEGKINLSMSGVREGFRLYQESLHILSLTIYPVAQYVLAETSKEKRAALRQEFETLLSEKTSYRCFEILLSFIEENCTLDVIKECYGKLRELLAWGYPFALIRIQKQRMCSEYLDEISRMIQALSKDDIESFAGIWEELLRREADRSRTFGGL